MRFCGRPIEITVTISSEERSMGTPQIICTILLIGLIIFYMWYRKRQA